MMAAVTAVMHGSLAGLARLTGLGLAGLGLAGRLPGLGRCRRRCLRQGLGRKRRTGNTADRHGLLHFSKGFNVFDRLLPRDGAIPAAVHATPAVVSRGPIFFLFSPPDTPAQTPIVSISGSLWCLPTVLYIMARP